MSDTNEIMAVFYEDIEKKSRIVENKFGRMAFLDGCRDMRVFSLGEKCGAERIRCSEFKPRKKRVPKCL